MTEDRTVAVVVRSFQGRATFFSGGFNENKFRESVVAPVREVLHSRCVASVIIVTCGDGDFNKGYAEQVLFGEMPTTAALRAEFPDDIASGRVFVHVCREWGRNAGSATALNEGFAIAEKFEVPFVMTWSPELKISPGHIELALAHIERHHLDVCGFLRSLHWFKPQWQVPQNTGALWKTELLWALSGFSADCNGDGKTTVSTVEFGEVPLAGMEDWELIVRAHKKLGARQPRLGMVCRQHPLLWDLSLKVPGTLEYYDHMKKVARQWEVMKAWTAKHFPDEPFEGVFMRIMGLMHFD